jgi:N-methylhydantoinase A
VTGALGPSLGEGERPDEPRSPKLPPQATAGALPTQPASATRAVPIKGTRPVYFPAFREFRSTTVHDRHALTAGAAFAGPTIVEERESTLVIGPGGRFEVASSGNIIVNIG